MYSISVEPGEQSVPRYCICCRHIARCQFTCLFNMSLNTLFQQQCQLDVYFSEHSLSDIRFDSDDDVYSNHDSAISWTSSSSDSSNSSDDSDNCDSTDSDDVPENQQARTLSAKESEVLCIVAYLLRHKVSRLESRNLLRLVQVLSPGFSMNPNDIWTMAEQYDVAKDNIYHYCPNCNFVFPDDANIFLCSKDGCDGVRYQGSMECQLKKGRKARRTFVIADVEKQLKSLFQKTSIWENLSKNKNSDVPLYMRDICDGKMYRKLCEPGNFLCNESHFSVIFNTDGIPLYSSTGEKLWPIFLCVNEIPVEQRFTRENTVLVGIWQGKGSPPFASYMTAFSKKMVDLYVTGFEITVSSESVCVKLATLVGTVDLQAKAYCLNMTQHNGEFGCITCEESGEVVVQGKGHSRCYPYRPFGECRSIRQSEEITSTLAPAATKAKRLKGICGKSGLEDMHAVGFDIVLSMVPDYMHGVLMGVVKTLMYKWFSSTNSKKDYFVGNKLKQISQRLGDIKPPDYLDRLPRNLEKEYQHLKANELQAWLLYFAVPCLTGILNPKYVEHFALLSEGIYILLGDSITEEELIRSENLLCMFYKDFADLYGKGSCGLNVHNIGRHLVMYVRLWGPIFCWSCFGFEDANADVLKSVHGTGDVKAQILRYKYAQANVRSFMNCKQFPDQAQYSFLCSVTSEENHLKTCWKKLTHCGNCSVAGSFKPFPLTDDRKAEFLCAKFGVDSLDDVKLVQRVQVKSHKFYSRLYTRMKRRICYVVLVEDGSLLSIEMFAFVPKEHKVFAIGFKIVPKQSLGGINKGGRHISIVEVSSDLIAVSVDTLLEKVLFMSPKLCPDYVVRLPNLHGRSVLK